MTLEKIWLLQKEETIIQELILECKKLNTSLESDHILFEKVIFLYNFLKKHKHQLEEIMFKISDNFSEKELETRYSSLLINKNIYYNESYKYSFWTFPNESFCKEHFLEIYRWLKKHLFLINSKYDDLKTNSIIIYDYLFDLLNHLLPNHFKPLIQISKQQSK